MSTHDYVVTAAAIYLAATALLAAWLIAKGTFDGLGRRADLAIDNFVMRVGPEGWGSIVIFPIVTNVGSAMLVAGSVSVANAVINGDHSFWLGYGTAIAGLTLAIGVPVWASHEFKNPDRVSASVLLYALSKDVNESTKTAALAAVERETSTANARIANTYGTAFTIYVSFFVLGTLWFCVLSLGAGQLSSWGVVGGYAVLVAAALTVRGPIRRRGLQHVVEALARYRAMATNALARNETQSPSTASPHGSASIAAALVAGAAISWLLSHRGRPR